MPGTEKGPSVPGTRKNCSPGTETPSSVPGNRFLQYLSQHTLRLGAKRRRGFGGNAPPTSSEASSTYRSIRCDRYCSKAGLYASETWMKESPTEMS